MSNKWTLQKIDKDVRGLAESERERIQLQNSQIKIQNKRNLKHTVKSHVVILKQPWTTQGAWVIITVLLCCEFAYMIYSLHPNRDRYVYVAARYSYIRSYIWSINGTCRPNCHFIQVQQGMFVLWSCLFNRKQSEQKNETQIHPTSWHVGQQICGHPHKIFSHFSFLFASIIPEGGLQYTGWPAGAQLCGLSRLWGRACKLGSGFQFQNLNGPRDELLACGIASNLTSRAVWSRYFFS